MTLHSTLAARGGVEGLRGWTERAEWKSAGNWANAGSAQGLGTCDVIIIDDARMHSVT